jgi:hypothetical protein
MERFVLEHDDDGLVKLKIQSVNLGRSSQYSVWCLYDVLVLVLFKSLEEERDAVSVEVVKLHKA